MAAGDPGSGSGRTKLESSKGHEHVQHAAPRCRGVNPVRDGPQVHTAFPQQVHGDTTQRPCLEKLLFS